MAISSACQEALWLKQVLCGLGYDFSQPIQMFNDNKSAIEIAHNTSNHSRSKHIDIKHHFIRNLIRDNQVKLDYVSTKENIADLFTKPLNKNLFNTIVPKLGITGLGRCVERNATRSNPAI